MVTEREVSALFKDYLKTRRLKTKLQREYTLNCGRADFRLPNYDVVIECKGSEGDVRKGIGQVISYSSELGERGYLLLPAQEIKREYIDWAERASLGVLGIREVWSVRGIELQVYNDIGGGMSDLADAKYCRDEVSDTRKTHGAATEYVLGQNESTIN